MNEQENKKAEGNYKRQTQPKDAHLSDEEIIAYRYGTLTSPETELRAQDHLVECRKCTDLLLELNVFAESTDAAADVSNNKNLDLQWKRFEKKLLADQKGADQITAANRKADSKPANNFFGFLSFNFARLAAAAAIFISLTGGLIFLMLQKTETNRPEITQKSESNDRTAEVARAPEKNESKITEPQNNSETSISSEYNGNQSLNSSTAKTRSLPQQPPQSSSSTAKNNPAKSSPRPLPTMLPSGPKELALNTVDFELFPNEAVRAGEADLRKIRVSTSAQRIRLKLKTPLPGNFSGFRFEIVDQPNRTVLSGRLKSPKRGEFILTVPPARLPAGIYSLKIYGLQNNERQLFSAYGFAVEYQ